VDPIQKKKGVNRHLCPEISHRALRGKRHEM
jgi:hypothetical protein